MKLKKIILIFVPIIVIVVVGIIILLGGGNLFLNSDKRGTSNQDSGGTTPSNPTTPTHTHNWILYDTIDSTCYLVGHNYYKCDVESCFETYEEEISMKEHTPQIIEGINSTCFETGLTEGKICSVCQYILQEQTETPILEHEYVDNICIHCEEQYFTPNSDFTLNDSGDEYEYITPYEAESIVIPDTYNGIPVTSFEIRPDIVNQIEEIVIGNNITTIPYLAFQHCVNLKSVTIGSGVTTIESYAFNYCSSLEELIIPDNVTTIEENAFSWCTNMKKIVVGNGIEVLPFCSLEAEEIILGNNVKIIEKGALSGTKTISIPNNIEYIGSWNLDFIENTTEYNGGYYVGNENNPYLVLVKTDYIFSDTFEFHQNCKIIYEDALSPQPNLETLIIPDSIVHIGERAISGCHNLTSLKIGNNVKYIDEDFILGSDLIEKLTIPSSVIQIKHNSFVSVKMITVDMYNPIYDSRDGCNAIIDKTTNTLIAGTSVTKIPESVEHIGEYAFWLCTFSSIKIPDSVKTIGKSAFESCHNLSSIKLPDSVIEVGSSVFWDCSSLKKVEIGTGLKQISNNMFQSCISLENLLIGENVELIDYSAFENCKKLTEIYLPKSIKVLSPGSFTNSYITKIYYEGSLEEWNAIQHIDAFIGVEVEVIYDYIPE